MAELIWIGGCPYDSILGGAELVGYVSSVSPLWDIPPCLGSMNSLSTSRDIKMDENRKEKALIAHTKASRVASEPGIVDSIQ